MLGKLTSKSCANGYTGRRYDNGGAQILDSCRAGAGAGAGSSDHLEHNRSNMYVDILINQEGKTMTMTERYGRRSPCILDTALFDKLPEEQQDYLVEYDFFLHYDDEDTITLGSWENDEKFDSIEELIEYVDEEIKLAAEAGCWER